MLFKYRRLILLLILIFGFILRFYAAKTVVINQDEFSVDLPSAKDISFSLINPKLPLMETAEEGSPAAIAYIIKIGWFIFGNSLMGARLPFIIIGIITILLAYLFTKSAFNVETGLLAAFLLCINEYYVHITRLADYNCLQILIVIISLLIFYRAISNSSQRLLLLNGLVIGIGFWLKESTILLIPMYLIFLFTCQEYKFLLKNKYLWISFAITFIVMLPLICVILSPNVKRLDYLCDYTQLRVSINAIGFYLGELILLGVMPFPNIFYGIAGNLESEFPIVNFVLGILMLISVLVSIRNRKPVIRLLVVCFLVNFLIFSLISSSLLDRRMFYFSLENLDWSVMGYAPGVILVANNLNNFVRRKRAFGGILLVFLIIFMLIRTFDVVTYPLHCFFPTREYAIRKLLDNYGISWMEQIGLDKTKQAAKDIYLKIFEISDNNTKYKKLAALKLAQLLIQDGDYKDSKKYLYYVLSKEADNKVALDLINKLKNSELQRNQAAD